MYIHTYIHQINDIPRGHAIACPRKLEKSPREHIPEFLAYERNVKLVDIDALNATAHCPAPILNRGGARPRTEQIRKGDDEKKPERQQHLGLLPDVNDRARSRCGLGPNDRTCTDPVCVPLGCRRNLCNSVIDCKFRYIKVL
jgi:hypothetical protein